MMTRNESRLALVALTAMVALGVLALGGCAKEPVTRIGTQPAISPGGTLIALEAGPVNKKNGKVEPEWVNAHTVYIVKAANEQASGVQLPDSNAPTAMAWRATPAGSELTYATYPCGGQGGELRSVLVPGPEQRPVPVIAPAPTPTGPAVILETQTPAAVTAPADPAPAATPEPTPAPETAPAPEAVPADEPGASSALPAPARVIAPLTASIEIETIPTTVSTPIPATEPVLVPAPMIAPAGAPVLLPEGLKVIGLAWSPSGNLLALAMENAKLKCVTLMLYDGKAFYDTGIQLSTGKFVWLCDTILYAQRCVEKKKNQQIIEIKLQDNQASVNRVYAIGKDLQLVGLLDNKLVWVRDKQVYQADRAFFGSSEKITNIFTDTPVVALSTNKRIHVVDNRPNFRSDRALEKGSLLVGASAGYVYVLKDRGEIHRYSYSLTSPYTSDRDEVTTVFELCPIGLRP